MRYRWLFALIVIALVISVYPAHAEIVEIEPQEPDEEQEHLLEPDEVEKITRLQRAVQPAIVSPISPDDVAVLMAFVRPTDEDIEVDFAFLNVQDGSMVPTGEFLQDFLPLTNISWRDGRTAVFLALDSSFNVVLALIDRTTGQATSEPVEGLPGFPVSLSPDGTGLLVLLFPEEEEDESFSLESPFDVQVRLRPPQARFPALAPPKATLPGLAALQSPNPLVSSAAAFQDESDDTMEMSSEDEKLAYFNLVSGEVDTLMPLPEGSGLLSAPTWSRDGSRLALVRTTVGEEISRGGVSLEDLITQDALGSLSPADNPLFQGNVVDVFDLSGDEVQSFQLKAPDSNGDVFAGVSWSTDNHTLLARMQRPSRLPGREHPVYTYPESSYIRFYNIESRQVIGVFDAPEISAPNAIGATFVSPDEVIFAGVRGLSSRIYYYNRVSGEFREISNRDGFYSPVLPTRFSRQIVFGFSSFQHPPELYRIGWDGEALAALTYSNIELEQSNQVQVNRVSFTMNSGAVREGYILQPAGAPFPPRNEPMVVWQEGGPGGTMISRWAANVEAPFALLPNAGFSMLILPLPGREGWGPQFYSALANGRNFGTIDIDEAAQAVRQMIARGYTSPDRVGITGCSYGGYFTSQSIARYPDLYAAANTQCTLLDTVTEWQTGFTWFMSYLMGRALTAEPAEFVQDSPGFQASAIRTPTLIFHGEFDFLPLNIAETFHKDIDTTGTPVRMLQFADEGHGLGDPEHQLIAAQEQINWFRQHLAGTPPAAPYDTEDMQEDDTPEDNEAGNGGLSSDTIVEIDAAAESEAGVPPQAPAPVQTQDMHTAPVQPAAEQHSTAPAVPADTIVIERALETPAAPAAPAVPPAAPAQPEMPDAEQIRASLVRGLNMR
jgi:pimeloyl-ACP methyl ester carboxylesterase